MPDALTISREWFELLEGLPTVQSRWNVLNAAAGYAFDGREPGKEDLSSIEKSIFMNMKTKIQNRKRRVNYYANHKGETLQCNATKNSGNRYNVTLQCNGQKTAENLSSNQHIDTNNIPSPSLSNDRVWFPHDEKDTARRVFKSPTLEEVTEYCKTRRNAVNPQQFIDFYTAKNWMIGKNKMKDWKAAVRTWEQRQYQEQTRRKPKRDYSGI